MENKEKIWYRVLDNRNSLPEGRVKSVTAGHKGICLTHFEGKFSALDNKCPHQGGPLGEGSIEKGMLRCPWHGWDFHPCTGLPPGGYDDGVPTYEVKEEDGVVYVGLEPEPVHEPTISDIMVETMINWGVDRVFGMVGHSNLGFADAMKRKEQEGKLKYFGIRHEGAASFAASAYGKLTGKPAACFSIAGPGATNMYTGLVGCPGRSSTFTGPYRASSNTGSGYREFSGSGSGTGFSTVWQSSIIEFSVTANMPN